MKNLAIITARGGSKRIPRKNIRDFCGKPIIGYSIEAAIKSSIFDEIMVSTDDEKIAEIAKQYGAVVPFIRSKENSDDFSTTVDVLFEVISKYKESKKEFKNVCCIYPTAPFVNDKKLKDSFYQLMEKKGDSLIPVVKYSYPIQRALKFKNDKLVMNSPEYINNRSQDLTSMYHDCGQFYWIKTEELIKQKSLFTKNTIPFVIPDTEVRDIDNEEDWKIAEVLYKCLNLD